jgi:hypothetical protein
VASPVAGIYANGVVITSHGIGVSLLEEYVFTPFDAARTPEYGPSEVKVLRALLQAGCPVVRPPAANKYRRHEETMLTYSTYQGHGPKVRRGLRVTRVCGCVGVGDTWCCCWVRAASCHASFSSSSMLR